MSIDLVVQQQLGGSAQSVEDQFGNSSSLAISSSQVCIGTTTPNSSSLLTLSGDIGPGPSESILSQGSEASIAYQDSSGTFWTVGSGGAGPNLQPGTFFFWNSEADQGVLTINPSGTLTLLTGDLNVLSGELTVNNLSAAGTANVNDLLANNITAETLSINVSLTSSGAGAPDPSRLIPLVVDPETGKIYLHK